MRPVEGEAALVAQPALELVGQRGRRVDDRAAVVAHDVHMVVLGGPVSRCTVVKVGVPHEPEFLEQFERAVHGRQVDLGRRIGDLLRGGMPHRAHGDEHPLALRGDPQSAGVQSFGQVRTGHRLVMVSAHGSNGR